MNKKFSTLMASLLLAGGMFSTANAETLKEAAAIENGFFHVYVHNNADNISETIPVGTNVLTEGTDGNYSILLTDENKNDKAYIWQVKKVTINGTVGYQLVNAKSGKTLSVKVGDVTYDTFNGNDIALWYSDNQGFIGKADDVNAQGTTGQANTVWRYNLQQVEPEVADADGLNELYNSIGFNMEVSGVTDQAAIKNLFATSGRVLALDVASDVNSPNKTTDGAAYPKGTYFVTSTPAGKTWAEISKITLIPQHYSLTLFISA